MHYQGGTTCHVAMAVISRPPLPNTQAGRRPLLIYHLRLRVHHMESTWQVPLRRTWPRTITPETSNSPRKLVGDGRATELVSHGPSQPTTVAEGSAAFESSWHRTPSTWTTRKSR